MAYSAKTRNSRRVRAIAVKRDVRGVVAWVVFALLSFALVFANVARAEPLNAELQSKVNKCQADLESAFKESSESLNWNESSQLCPLNRMDAQHLKAENNFRWKNKPEFLKKQEDKIVSNHDGTEAPSFGEQDGICERSLESARWAFQSLVKRRSKICHETMASLNGMFHCYGGSSIKECETSLRKMNDLIESDYKHTTNLLKDLDAYLEKSSENVAQAKKRYQDDLSKLTAPNGIQTAGAIAANGRAQSNEDYLPKLAKNPAAFSRSGISARTVKDEELGEVVQEQISAQKTISKLRADMKSYLVSQNKFHDEMKDSVGKFKPAQTDNNYGQYLGPATTAAGALSSVTGGGAASALPLAAAAAGGAASLASAGKSSVASGFDGSGASAPGAGPQIAQTGTSTTGGAPAGTNAAPAPGQLVPITDSSNPNAGKENNRGPSSDTYIPPSKLVNSGSSTSNGRGGAAATPATNGATTAPAGSTEDLLHSFNDAIKPMPAPSKKKDDGLGDMNSIFGQVSKMFNFDQASGTAEPSAPVESPFVAENSSPNGEFNDGFQYGSGGGGGGFGSASADETAVTGNLENASPAEREMMQYGSVGTPLFQRVHSRHRICMEKGLLLQEFGRLPR